MENDKLEGLLIDFIDGRLNEGERKQVKELLSTDEEVRVLYEQLKQVTAAMDRSSELNPSSKLHSSFQQMLAEEESKVSNPAAKQVFFTPTILRAAAAVLLVMVGGAIGYWINQYNMQQQQLAAMQEEMRKMREEMYAKLGNETSASQRMLGVNVALSLSKSEAKADDDVVNALVRTMNEDRNTNVRLAALEALTTFQDEPNVRKALIASLSKQDDPVVQIALIQLMVKMKEKGVIKDLNRIIEDNNAIQPVKDEAHSGLIKLS